MKSVTIPCRRFTGWKPITQVRNLKETTAAIAAIAANVLVLDPRDVTANQCSEIAQAFQKDMPRASEKMML